MPVKVTEVSVRPSTDIEWPSGNMFGADVQRIGIRSRPGFISKTDTVSDDGLTLTEVHVWEDNIEPYEVTAEQLALRQQFDAYCAANNIEITVTREQI